MPRSEDEITEIEQLLGSEADDLSNAVYLLLLKRLNVILYGPPGTGKSRVSFQIQNRWGREHGEDAVFPITFHPSYGYEDFVRGFRPATTSDKQQPRFELQDGILLQACARAADGPVLLAIDEINRGDVARIFGELITYIEADKRNLPFFISIRPSEEAAIVIPANLHILGTMNSADKSVSLLDVALRRRFALREIAPDPGAFARSPSWLADIEGIDLAALLVNLNTRLVAAGVEPDRTLGHALFGVNKATVEPVAELRERFAYDVYPLITEYFFLDRGRIATVLGGIVDSEGRLRNGLGDQEFLSELKKIIELTSDQDVPGSDSATGEPI